MHGIVELLGAFLVVIGLGTIVAAASLVSTALAVLAAGVFLVGAGSVAAYAAAVLERRPPTKAGDRP